MYDTVVSQVNADVCHPHRFLIISWSSEEYKVASLHFIQFHIYAALDHLRSVSRKQYVIHYAGNPYKAAAVHTFRRHSSPEIR